MFDIIEQARLSELHIASDPECQLRAIIAIHNTQLGPSLGGCRFLEYDTDEAAIKDATRLAKGMSYKAAMAEVPQGGGKSVIIKPKGPFDRKVLFSAFGQFINTLGGRYITAVDSGSHIDDMETIAQQTPHVSGTKTLGGDPSPATALGVFEGIKSCIKKRYGTDALTGIHVAIQGIGNVGYALAEQLHQAGASLTVADINASTLTRAKDQFNATVVSPETIHQVACDVFAPCGLGGAINPSSLSQFHCKAIAGSANNQLTDETLGIELQRQGILYAPDYVINAGGLIHVSRARVGLDSAIIHSKIMHIGQTVTTILERAEKEGLPTNIVANLMAEERLYGRAL